MSDRTDDPRDRISDVPPDDAACREAHNVWISDDRGRFELPRIGIEAIGASWHDRGIQANVGFPTGRVLNGAGSAARVESPDGRMSFAAGPLSFELHEPFHRWSMTWSGPMRDTSAREQLTGTVSDRTVDVHLDVDMTMCVPPWVQGTMSAAAAARLDDPLEGAFMGGERFEQLFTCSGRLSVADDTWDFTGTGLRIQRRGTRETAQFWGHNWQSAVFPGGRAFGLICYPPRPDGSPSYAEAYVFDDGRMHPATILAVEWLTDVDLGGDDVSVALRTDHHGQIHIEGVTHAPTFSPQGGALFLDWMPGERVLSNPVTFQQAGARYSWDGETTYGMCERSLPDDQITRPR